MACGALEAKGQKGLNENNSFYSEFVVQLRYPKPKPNLALCLGLEFGCFEICDVHLNFRCVPLRFLDLISIVH